MAAPVENQITAPAFELKEPPFPNGHKNGTIRARNVTQYQAAPSSIAKAEEEPLSCRDILCGLTALFCRCICKCILID